MNGSEIFSVPIMRWDIEYNLLGCTLQSNSKSVNEIRDVVVRFYMEQLVVGQVEDTLK